jgi:thiol-disulfide isomerase/thioredoxin
MKNISLPLLLILASLIGCQKQVPVNNTIIVAGKLSNSEIGPIRAYSDEEIASDSVKEDGSFRIQFESKMAEYFTFRLKNTSFNLFLSPGDSIYIEANIESFGDSFQAHANKATENTYLRKKAKIISTHQMNNFMELMKKSKEEYFAKTDSIKTDLATLLKELKGDEKISKDFLKLEDAYLTYQFAFMDYNYPNYHSYINKLPSKDSVDFPIKEVEAKINSLNLEDPELLSLPAFRNIMDIKVSKIVQAKLKQDTTLKKIENIDLKLSYEVSDSIFKNIAIKESAKYKLVKFQLDYLGPNNSFYEDFIAKSSNETYINKLNESMAKWEPISQGKESPDFTFITVQEEEVMLSDLRGKLVYIDVWATWCGPCIAEHPHWNKMMEEYKDKDIAFVSVSIDDNKEPWIKMVTDKKMTGHQWFTENAWKSDLAQHYSIQAIPRFILLDKEGKIIDPSASRPSGSIRSVVDKYL